MTAAAGYIAAGAALVLGGAATLWGWAAAPHVLVAAWLAAFYFWAGVPLGALALLLIHDLTGGQWQRTARLPLEAAAATMPLFILLFLPVALNLGALYPWARAEDAADLPNRWYLNPDFFLLRAAAYLGLWCAVATLKLLWRGRALPAALSALGLVLLGLIASFAAIDWIMSIEPRWFSTIYGMVADASQFIAAMAAVLAVVALEGPAATADEPSYRDDLADLATILLAVLIFWAYASFCQYLIVWEENLSAEIGWYIVRGRDGWAGVIYGVAIALFLVPFASLVTTPAKRLRAVVGPVACLVLVADLVQVWWLALPPFGPAAFTWLAPAVAVFMGGAVGLVFLWGLRAGMTVPLRASRGQRLRHG